MTVKIYLFKPRLVIKNDTFLPPGESYFFSYIHFNDHFVQIKHKFSYNKSVTLKTTARERKKGPCLPLDIKSHLFLFLNFQNYAVVENLLLLLSFPRWQICPFTGKVRRTSMFGILT